MTLFIISFVAGILTVLAPCILPLLPVVVSSGAGARSRWTPYIVIGSLSASILVFTFLLKVSTAFIAIPTYVWGYLSGGILVLFGLTLFFPSLWSKIPGVNKMSQSGNQLVGTGYQKKSVWGDVVMGAALGPVFSSCSPTYFVILGVVLPESFLVGTFYLLTYIAGLAAILLAIALLGQKLTQKLNVVADSQSWFKRGIGALFVFLGIAIFFGLDKKFEAAILQTGALDGVLQIETDLLEKIEE